MQRDAVTHPARRERAHPKTHDDRASQRTPVPARNRASAPSRPKRRPDARKKQSRYVPALDGLRALAVVAVIFYHLGAPWAQGGLLGVTLFFVLSGYLITGILASELARTSTISLRQFWLRRVRRLFPAIFTVIIIVIVLCVLFNHPLLTKMRPDIVPSLFWFQNWWYVIRDVSYFENLGDPSPLTHFWSLAIEEQFYVVWPLLLLLVYKLLGRRYRLFAYICLALSVMSAAWMAFLFDPQADPTRVYYGTDTRAFSLLLGAALAFVWPVTKALAKTRSGPGASLPRKLDIAGTAALAGIVVMMVLVDGTSAFMYRGGLFLASVLTAVLMTALVVPECLWARVFSWAPLVWIGKRSYGMYLWHYPLILLLSPIDPAPSGHSWWLYLLVFALTFGISELSLRFVEDPIRHGAIGRALAELREVGLKACLRKRLLKPLALGTSVLCTALLAFAALGCIFVPDASVVPEEAITSTGAAVDSAIPDEAAGAGSEGGSADASGNAASESQGYNPLLIGDSVPGDSDNEFKSKFPNGLNDSYVSRSASQGIQVYNEYEEKERAGNVVVFACFSNHKIADGQLDELYEAVGPGRELFVINVKVSKSYESYNNKQLAAFAEKYETVHLIDWYSLAKEHMDEYLWDDKLHLKPTGARAYQDLIYENVKAYLPASDYNTTPAESSKYGQ